MDLYLGTCLYPGLNNPVPSRGQIWVASVVPGQSCPQAQCEEPGPLDFSWLGYRGPDVKEKAKGCLWFLLR